MKFTTLIPTRYNDGKRVPYRIIREFMDELTDTFGGCSDEGRTKGQWLDPHDATKYRDETHRVTVVWCDRIMLDDARAAVVRIGQRLKQRAMYFEVRDYDGVEFFGDSL